MILVYFGFDYNTLNFNPYYFIHLNFVIIGKIIFKIIDIILIINIVTINKTNYATLNYFNASIIIDQLLDIKNLNHIYCLYHLFIPLTK